MKTLLRLSIAVLSVVIYGGCGDDTTIEKHKDAAPKESSASTSNDIPSSVDPRGPHPISGPVGNAPKITPTDDKSAQEAGEPNTGELDFAGVRLTVPKSWIRKQPRSTIIMAEYAIPRAEGDSADGRVTASVAGGSVADNIARWEKQFGEKPEKESKEDIDAGGVKVTLIDLSGTFADSMGGPMSPSVERPDWRMVGAVFNIGDALHFIKCTGPAKTMAARADEVKAFIHSIKPDAAGK